MTNDELKKKVVDVLRENIEYELHYFPDDNYAEVEFDYDKIADALIAAWIGDASSEKAMRELAEAFYREKCAEYDLINYKLQNAEHRAARSERALHCLARSFAEAMCKYGDDTHYLVDGFIQDAYIQAEKELAKEFVE